MKILKFLAWVIVPYLMLLVTWKRLKKPNRIFGLIWTVLVIVATIQGQVQNKGNDQQASVQQANQQISAKVQSDSKVKSEQVAKAKEEVSSKAKAQAEADAKAKADADAKAKADADAKAQAEAVAKAKADAEAKAQADAAAKAQQATVQILSISDPAARNSTATLTAKVAPGAIAYIAVHYESGDSTAQGLGPKQADANGTVSWSWHVGGRTTLGTVPVTVTCNNASADTQFTVVH